MKDDPLDKHKLNFLSIPQSVAGNNQTIRSRMGRTGRSTGLRRLPDGRGERGFTAASRRR